MSKMNVSAQQVQKRFLSLPSELQDVLFSVQTAEIINKVCEENHIPAEKILNIAKVAGYVISGFIHPEEAQKEIAERTGLRMEIAKHIADALNSRLFSAIKDKLDKIYAPVPHPEESAEPVPLQTVTAATTDFKKPENVPPAAPAPTLPPKEAAPAVILKKEAVSVGAQASPTASSKPAPVMIFKKQEWSPLSKSATVETGSAPRIFDTKAPPPPPRPPVAKIELGIPETPKSQAAKSEVPSGRVTNYAQFKNPSIPSSPSTPQTPPKPSLPPENKIKLPEPPQRVVPPAGVKGAPVQRFPVFKKDVPPPGEAKAPPPAVPK